LVLPELAYAQDQEKLEQAEFVSPPQPVPAEPAGLMQTVDGLFGTYLVRPLFAIRYSDLMLLAMAFPNVLGLWIPSDAVRARLDDHWKRYQAGELDPHNHPQPIEAKLGVPGKTQAD